MRPVPALGNGGSPRPQGPRPPRRPADRRGQTQRWGSVDGAASPRCERRRAPDRGRWAWQLRRVAARCGVGLRPDPAGRRGHGVGVDDRERGPERSGGLPALRLTHRSLPAVSRSAPSARTVELSPRPASPGPGLVRVGVLFVPTHRLFRQLTGRLSRAVDVPSSSCMRPFPWPRLAYLGRPAFLGCCPGTRRRVGGGPDGARVDVGAGHGRARCTLVATLGLDSSGVTVSVPGPGSDRRVAGASAVQVVASTPAGDGGSASGRV